MHPEAKPFHNKGWPYLYQMDQLMPGSLSGSNVFCPLSSTARASSPSSQPCTLSLVRSDRGNLGIISAKESSDSETEETLNSSTGLNAKQKREPAMPTPVAAKHHCSFNGAAALMSMAESLGAFNTILAIAFAQPSTAPVPASSTPSIPVISTTPLIQAITSVLTHKKSIVYMK
uniref:Uncharacterized protein n=1 Tax=Psilocybe cubensis TaxID=181762 RepID=A0A8H8CGI5_PSICU